MYGRPVAYATIKADSPSPVTETGYLSQFTRPELVEAEGGAAARVLAWLDFAAAQPAFELVKALAAQLSLF